jgi:acyl-CoA thioesterase FadM
MKEPFQVRVAVRGYELDVNGHLNWAHYLHYAEHARWECLRAAGLSFEVMVGAGLGPVNLEANLRFLRELRTATRSTSAASSCGAKARPTGSGRSSPAPPTASWPPR